MICTTRTKLCSSPNPLTEVNNELPYLYVTRDKLAAGTNPCNRSVMHVRTQQSPNLKKLKRANATFGLVDFLHTNELCRHH